MGEPAVTAWATKGESAPTPGRPEGGVVCDRVGELGEVWERQWRG
jgi:hypothetical protein